MMLKATELRPACVVSRRTVFGHDHPFSLDLRVSRTPLLADGEHREAAGLQDILAFVLRHGSGDRDLMVVRMAPQQCGVAHDDGFLTRLVVLYHVVVRIRAFVEASGDAE